jgi:hypothetical protein
MLFGKLQHEPSAELYRTRQDTGLIRRAVKLPRQDVARTYPRSASTAALQPLAHRQSQYPVVTGLDLQSAEHVYL